MASMARRTCPGRASTTTAAGRPERFRPLRSEAHVPLLLTALRAAWLAGREILSVYETDFAVETKSDESPLTEADRRSQERIREILAEADASIPFLGEEGREIPYAERRAWNRFWLVDPLDGTKEFITGNGEFTVNIALVSGEAPVLGVVLAPALDLLYFGRIGAGAWRREADGPVERIHSSERPATAPRVVVESRSHPSAELEAYLAGIRVERRIAVGSSLKLCWVADGRADLYPRFGPTMEWDVAAGDCVYRAAGRGGANPSPLRYNKPDLRNGSFVLGR